MLGVTKQVDPLVPAHVPVQTYEVAAGVQLAVKVDDAPAATDAGFGVNWHTGTADPPESNEPKDSPSRTSRRENASFLVRGFARPE